MSIIQQYSYPSQDILTIGWSGVSNDTLKYSNIDEGIYNVNLNDYLYKSGLVSEINGRHSIQFTTGALHVLPSSTFYNINVNASSSNILNTGNLWLERALLLDSNSGIIAQYEYKSAGEPTYSWGLTSDFSTKNVILSGFTTDSSYFGSTSCDIRLSGNFSATLPTVDNFKLSISAFEFLSSGVIGVDFSGIPLYISGPRAVADCLKVIDASGYPVNPDTPIQTWIHDQESYVENSTIWWKSVGSGVHTPNDQTYIKILIDSYEHPAGVSGTREATSWLTEVGGAVTPYSTVSIYAINSGTTTPVDGSYWKRVWNFDVNHSGFSPEILFERPTGYNFGRLKARIRAQMTGTDYVRLDNFKLYDNTRSIISQFSDSFTLDTSIQDYETGFINKNNLDFSPINNYLTFDVFSSNGTFASGQARFMEVDLYFEPNSIASPSFYFHAPTINNLNAGATTCFRMESIAGIEIPVTLSNVKLTSPTDITLITFDDLMPTVPVSSFQNFCTRSLNNTTNSGFIDRSYLTFTTAVPSGYNINDVLFSEIELCCSGLDPSSSDNIPLYISGPGEANPSGIPLYIYGNESSNSGISLFVEGYGTDNSGIPLYTVGHLTGNSGLPLYIYGHDTSSSGIPLYTAGHLSDNSGIPLYINGPIPTSSWMPLFLKAETIPNISNSTTLFTWSTTNSGLFSTIPLYVGGSGSASTSMPLYLLGQEHDDTSSNMPLFLKTIGNLDGSLTVESGVPLFLGNYWTSVNSGILLYIKTAEGTEGSVPVSSWMPLFIARDTESTANNISMYLKVSDVGSGVMPMIINGAYFINSGIPLVIPSVLTRSSGYIQLYSHGI